MRKHLFLTSLALFALVGCQRAEVQVDTFPEGAPATISATATPLLPTGTPLPPTATAVQTTPTNTPDPTVEPATATQTSAPPTLTATAETEVEVEALWGKWGNLLFALSLMPDGSYEVVWPSEVGGSPSELGTYSFEQGRLSFAPETYQEETPSPTLDGCREQQPYSYQVVLLEDPRFMRLNLVNDFCGYRERWWDSPGISADEVWQQLEKFESE